MPQTKPPANAPASRESIRYGWVVIGTFTLNFSVIILMVLSLGLLLPDISEDLSLSPSQQGLLAAASMFANLALEIPFSLWLSRYRPWRIASLVFLFGAGVIAFNAWAPVFGTLLVARVLLGIAQLSTRAPMTLMMVQWIPSRKIGTANGVVYLIVDSLLGLGLILVPLLVELVGGWRSTLYTWSIVSLSAGILWILLGRERITPEYQERMKTQVGTPLIGVLKYKEVWLVALGSFGVFVGLEAYKSFYPTYIKDEFGLDTTVAGYVLGLMFLGMAPANLILSVVSFFSKRKPMVMVMCGLGLCLSYLGLLATSYVPFMILLGIISGVCIGYVPQILTLVFHLPGIKPREITVGIALIFSSMWSGGAVGPLLVGFVQQATDNLTLALGITAFVPLTLTVVGLFLSDTGKKLLALATGTSADNSVRAASLTTAKRD